MNVGCVACGVDGGAGVEIRNRGAFRETGPRGAGGEERSGRGEDLRSIVSFEMSTISSSRSIGDDESRRRFGVGSSILNSSSSSDGYSASTFLSASTVSCTSCNPSEGVSMISSRV